MKGRGRKRKREGNEGEKIPCAIFSFNSESLIVVTQFVLTAASMALYGRPASVRALVIASEVSSGNVGPSRPSGCRGGNIKL